MLKEVFYRERMVEVMNKIIVIGYLGIKRCYLNITKEEALKRYIDENGHDFEVEDIEEFEFKDEFSVYDIWE